MKRAAVLSLAAAAVLVVSIAAKLRFQQADVAADIPAFEAATAESLRRRGVDTSTVEAFGGPVTYGRTGQCRLAIRLTPISGELDQLTLRALRTFPRIRYLYRGQLFDSAPKLRPYVAFQAARAANRLGVKAGWSPMVTVADNRRCDDRLLSVVPSSVGFAPLHS